MQVKFDTALELCVNLQQIEQALLNFFKFALLDTGKTLPELEIEFTLQANQLKILIKPLNAVFDGVAMACESYQVNLQTMVEFLTSPQTDNVSEFYRDYSKSNFISFKPNRSVS